MNKVDVYRSLLDGYEEGMYTAGEVISISLGLLFQSDDREAFWQALAPDHRLGMAKLLAKFDETAEPFSIRGDPMEVWREMTELKRWFNDRTG